MNIVRHNMAKIPGPIASVRTAHKIIRILKTIPLPFPTLMKSAKPVSSDALALVSPRLEPARGAGARLARRVASTAPLLLAISVTRS